MRKISILNFICLFVNYILIHDSQIFSKSSIKSSIKSCTLIVKELIRDIIKLFQRYT